MGIFFLDLIDKMTGYVQAEWMDIKWLTEKAEKIMNNWISVFWDIKENND